MRCFTTRPSHAVAIAALAVLAMTAPARAQTPTGNIFGTVKDAQGAAVPGATVTATHAGTQYSRTATTDSSGEYALRLLPVVPRPEDERDHGESRGLDDPEALRCRYSTSTRTSSMRRSHDDVDS